MFDHFMNLALKGLMGSTFYLNKYTPKEYPAFRESLEFSGKIVFAKSSVPPVFLSS